MKTYDQLTKAQRLGIYEDEAGRAQYRRRRAIMAACFVVAMVIYVLFVAGCAPAVAPNVRTNFPQH